jgi:hypothetical protein
MELVAITRSQQTDEWVVIPAQAGIQLFEKTLRSWSKQLHIEKHAGFPPSRE